MNKFFLSGIKFSCLVFFMSAAFSTSMPLSSRADALEILRARLPAEAHGWSARTEDKLFDDRTIFQYINGAGEVYKAYNLRRCLSRRYRHPSGHEIILDLFDMGSPSDAFGVFTHDTDGQVVNIGQDARLRPGWLSFWKHRFFVSIYVQEESPAAEKAVLALGEAVAKAIPEEGFRPEILGRLPRRGLDAGNIRFLHHPIILNYHFYLAERNILNLSPKTDAVLAGYLRGAEKARLLLVDYPDAKKAKEALALFLKHYLPDADSTGTARLENGRWAAVRVSEKLLAAVLEADSRPLAESLLRPE